VLLTFRRLADRRPVETRVERDDGVVFEMRGPGGGAELPHDLVHALVERELRVADGVWGCVADGVVWGSMRHVSGRQPPHAAERSRRLKRDRARRVMAAEHLAQVVDRLAHGEQLPPAALAATGMPPAALAAAADLLVATGRDWAALSPGATWQLDLHLLGGAAGAPTPGRGAAGRGRRGRR
jgi:hypothetical protein